MQKTTRTSGSKNFKPAWLGTLAALALLAAALALAGCKQPASQSDAGPTGTYKLVSVGGKSVPCTVQHEGSPTVKSGTFTFNPDGTCTSLVLFSIPSGQEMNREVKATYTRQGPELTMSWEGAGTTKGRYTSNTFEMTNEGIVFAYAK
jgi:uncharacterized lipoprotein YajG